MICSTPRLRRLLAWLICLALLPSVTTRRPAAAQDDRLSPTGPWLVYTAEDGLVAANPDGSGRTRLAPAATPQTEFLVFPSPIGDRFLLVTIVPGESGMPHADLRLVGLPGGGGRALRSSLLPDGPAARLLAPLLLDALRDGGGLAWAPGGDRVAFASAHAGQLTLVIFNLNSGTSTSLETSGAVPEGVRWAAHGRHLLWAARSLDGQRTVMGMSFASASGRVQDRPPAALALPESPLDSWRFIGWQTPNRALFSARQTSGTLAGVVVYDFITGEHSALLPPDLALTAAGVLDDTLLFGVAPGGSLPAGLYRLDPGGMWTLLQPGTVTAITADAPRGAFWIGRPEGDLLIPAAGGTAQALPAGTAYPAPSGSAVARLRAESAGWDSLWLAPQAADQPALIWPGQAWPLAWSADGAILYAVLRPAPGATAALNASGLAAIPLASGQPSFLDSRAVPGVLAVLTPRTLSLLADRDVPLRHTPDPGGTVQATLAGDEPIARLQGRNRAGDWISIELEDGRSGWVPLAALTTTVRTEELTILQD